MENDLKREVFRANRDLVSHGLVVLTWGNASAIDRRTGRVYIKPSGIDYEVLKEDDIVVVDLDGNVLEGNLRPSSDLATHLVLYKTYPGIGGVTHTHSYHATIFAQAGKGIAVYGTTHADAFAGPIPCSRDLTREEVECEYEKYTGDVIVETMIGIDPLAVPACLVRHHGPFVWGPSVAEAVKNAVTLEQCAAMAMETERIGGVPAADFLIKRHYERKHGKKAYYGQKGDNHD